MRIASLAAVLLLLLAGCSSSPDAEESGNDATASLPSPESNVVTGTILPPATSSTVQIPVQDAGHGRLAVALVMGRELPYTLTLNVTGPGGRTDEVQTGPLLYVLPGSSPVLSFATPEAGTWTAVVTMGGTADVVGDFEVHWCADDAAAKGPSSNLACHRY